MALSFQSKIRPVATSTNPTSQLSFASKIRPVATSGKVVLPPKKESVISKLGKPVEASNDNWFNRNITAPLFNAEVGAIKGAASTIATVPQSVGKVGQAVFDVTAGKDFTKAIQTISNSNNSLLDEIKAKNLKTTDPARYSKLMGIIKDNQQQINTIMGQEESSSTLVDTMATKPKVLEAEGTAQKVGYGAEKIVEFVYGGKKLANPLEATAVNALKTSALSPVTRKVAQVGVGALAEGTAAGVISKAQGASNEEALKTGAISAAISIPFKVLDVLREPVKGYLETTAQKKVSQAIGATTKENKQISEKVVPEMLKRKVLFVTRKGLQNKVTATADEVGAKIGEAFDDLPPDAQNAISPIIQRLEDAKSQFVVAGTNRVPEAATGSYKALQNLQDEIITMAKEQTGRFTDVARSIEEHFATRAKMLTGSADAIETITAIKSAVNDAAVQIGYRTKDANLQNAIQGLDLSAVNSLDEAQALVGDTVNQYLAETGSISTQSLRSFRQILDKIIAKSKGGFGMTGDETVKLAAQKEGANAIRNVLAEDYPDIAKLNKEFTFWKNIEKVVGATVQRTKSQAQPLGETIAEGAGAGGALARGGGAGHVILTPIGLKLLKQAITSPAWRNTSGVIRQSLADAISSGATAKATQILNRILYGGVNLPSGQKP